MAGRLCRGLGRRGHAERGGTGSRRTRRGRRGRAAREGAASGVRAREPRTPKTRKAARGISPGPPRHANAPRWSATSCSPTDYSAVPSALGGLTSGFGMGPGVPPPPWSLTNEGHSVVRGRASPGALGAAQRSESSDRRSPDRDFRCQGKEELGLLVQLG